MAPLPNFLIIGAQKSGTRWVRTNLDAHPDVFTASGEPSYFGSQTSKTLDWYRSCFAGARDETAIGEATPAYMMLRPPRLRDLVADSIDRTLPGVRLVAILRNPVDRAVSGFLHARTRRRIADDVDCFEMLASTAPDDDPLGLIRGSLYGASLEPFVERFGERLLVLRHDDLVDDAADVYRRVCEHVGVDPTIVPDDLTTVRFSNRTDESPMLDITERRRLWPLFENDVGLVQRLTGLDTSVWQPDRPSTLH